MLLLLPVYALPPPPPPAPGPALTPEMPERARPACPPPPSNAPLPPPPPLPPWLLPKSPLLLL